ncbi:MAG: FG-GAP-like repeat-containing protein, partial [Myxococcota bacterium]
MNGDGHSDVLVGAPGASNGHPGEGRVYLFLGSGAGLAATPAWSFEPNVANAELGQSVAGIGDVNGDGFGDVAVGAPGLGNGQDAEGRIYVFYGATIGLASTPDFTLESNEPGARLGEEVNGPGDVNGDGYDDFVVGAPTWTGALAEQGRAQLHLGSETGLSSAVDWVVEGSRIGARFGQVLGWAGDVNGDGYADLVVGMPAYSDGETGEGRVELYTGQPGGLSDSPFWVFESDIANLALGAVATGVGDANGDGLADVLLGAPGYTNGEANEGQFAVLPGSASGPVLGAPLIVVESNQAGAMLGASGASAGDLNGDGFLDVAMGAPSFDAAGTDRGRVYLHHGAAAPPALTEGIRLEADSADAFFGEFVESAGDVNADGFDDLIVGSYNYSGGQSEEGRAYLYLGGPNGISSSPDWTYEPDHAGDHFGTVVSAAGDVNGDGFADIIATGDEANYGSAWEGRAWVFLGSAGGLETTPVWTAESNAFLAYYGWSASGVGDIDGDGFADVMVGSFNQRRAYLYRGSSSGPEASASWTYTGPFGSNLGASVAGAGDVNGDGYGDVIIGAENYDNGQNNEGAAFLFFGSAGGLAGSPDWSHEGDIGGIRFGTYVAGAGDVNGDGYADVIIGAERYSNGESEEGRAYAFYGSPTGLPATPCWVVESNQATARFGESVGPAGDVNGDGYGDVIVGGLQLDNGQTNEGGAWLYLGGPSGLSTTPAWTGEGEQDGARYGGSAWSAGDLNADGFSDIVVGADSYSNGQDEEGVAFIYYGNSGVLPPSNRPRIAQARDLGTGQVLHPQARTTTAGFRVTTNVTPSVGRKRARIEVQFARTGESYSRVFGPWVDTELADVTLSRELTGLNLGATHWRTRLSYAASQAGPVRWSPWRYGGLAGDSYGFQVQVFGGCAPIASNDATCDGIDDDCDGDVDEDFVGTTSYCGTGACASTGVSSCVAGRLQDNCSPLAPALEDTTCDVIDDDCDGSFDEDYPSLATICGVGVCVASGATRCEAGSVIDDCAPLEPPQSIDDDCDGLDDDCDGFTDEEIDLVSACGEGTACSVVTCNPELGACESSLRTGCCETDSDCADSAACVTGRCADGACELILPGDCCRVDSECDDGNACTDNRCNVETGQCVIEGSPRCCTTSADCDDGNSCSFDACGDENRCIHQTATCETIPCGADT